MFSSYSVQQIQIPLCTRLRHLAQAEVELGVSLCNLIRVRP